MMPFFPDCLTFFFLVKIFDGSRQPPPATRWRLFLGRNGVNPQFPLVLGSVGCAERASLPPFEKILTKFACEINVLHLLKA